MWISSEPVVFCLSVAVFLAGFVSVILMRITGGHQCQAKWHCLFYVALIGLGVLTVMAAGVDNGAWLTSGAGLSVITVGATLDFERGAGDQTPF